MVLSAALIIPCRLVVAAFKSAVSCVAVKSSTSPVHAVVRHLYLFVATVASFAFVTTLLSIVHTVPEVDRVISPLSPSESTGKASILSYRAFLVGTSVLPFHPTQYASSGTEISPVNVPPLFSALSVLRVVKLSLIFVSQSVFTTSVVSKVSIVDINYIGVLTV